MQAPNQKDLEGRFSELLRANCARWRRIARSYAAPGEHEDLLQDILAQIWRSLPSFDGRAQLSSWAYRIALNTAMGSLRKRYREPALLLMPHEELLSHGGASAGNPADPDDMLDAFLSRLTPIDRAVLMLSLDNLSYAEIADITGVNSNAVGIRLNRIKQRLIEDHVEEYT